MKSNASGGFRSTDARSKYGGKGLVPKCGARVKANFSNPLVPNSSVKGSASSIEGGDGGKGEKSKIKKDVVGGA